MGTLILDFDSTLITRESLEELLKRARPDLAAEIAAITAAGMDGRMSFRESMEKRLALARPTRAEVEALGREALGWITAGMEGALGAVEADVWLVSGGLTEAMLPVAAHLGIPAGRILATVAHWSAAGELVGVEVHDKPDQIRSRAGEMPKPRVLVGDGMTDYEPFREGLVDHFVAFTANVRRKPVVATGAPEAASAGALGQLLARLLHQQ